MRLLGRSEQGVTQSPRTLGSVPLVVLLPAFPLSALPGDALRDPRLNLAVDPPNWVARKVGTQREYPRGLYS
jgi:hypothetical protein